VKTIIVYGLIGVFSLVWGYEPSVYGAGDIESANPYGLTKTEEAVLENKKRVQTLYNRVKEQQRKIEGLTTVIEGQNREIVVLKEELKVVSKRVDPLKRDSNKTYTLLLELGKMLDTINNSYVSRDELQGMISNSGGGGNNQEEVSSTTNSYQENGSSYIRSNSGESRYREAINLFSMGSYSLAKEAFSEAVLAKYKPASSNYYLGECSYYMRNYQDAIAYYKQSSSMNDKASYIPRLYLHTAISLSNSGEEEQAKGFFKYIIENYPNTKSAYIAEKRI